ncbi:hypothetical protein GQ53DRAFT_16267 [Thozetella sp. PMI_491]|nr:hypothetical protein GQ53DRAFT_16267 [Thozetella sp. PMI_491]
MDVERGRRRIKPTPHTPPHHTTPTLLATTRPRNLSYWLGTHVCVRRSGLNRHSGRGGWWVGGAAWMLSCVSHKYTSRLPSPALRGFYLFQLTTAQPSNPQGQLLPTHNPKPPQPTKSTKMCGGDCSCGDSCSCSGCSKHSK